LPDKHQYWNASNYTAEWDLRGGVNGDLKASGPNSQCCGERGAWTCQHSKCEDLNNFVKGKQDSAEVPGAFCDAEQTDRPVPHPHNIGLTTRSYYDWEEQNTATSGLQWPDQNTASTDAVHKWFADMDEYTKTTVPAYLQKRSECADARDDHKVRVLETHRLQTLFEEAFCSWAQSIDTMCFDYRTCFDNKKKLYDAAEAIVREEEKQFKNQMHSLEYIMCYGQQILDSSVADPANVAKCEDINCQKCSKLDIAYPDPPAFLECSEKVADADRPCSETFLNAEYGCFNDETPPNTCATACPAE